MRLKLGLLSQKEFDEKKSFLDLNYDRLGDEEDEEVQQKLGIANLLYH